MDVVEAETVVTVALGGGGKSTAPTTDCIKASNSRSKDLINTVSACTLVILTD